MDMVWTDVDDIVFALLEQHPDQDPQYVRFTDLHQWILALDNFKDKPDRCNEKILEAIQMRWIEEAE